MRFIVLLLIPTLCLAAPKHPMPTPKGPVEKQGLVCRTKQDDLLLRDWITGLINEVHKAQADTKQANDSNAQTQLQLTASVKAATDLANECAADKKCAKSPLSCWFHRLLKHILWVVIALVIILVAVTILAPGVMPLVVSFFTFIWKWILALFSPKPKL